MTDKRVDAYIAKAGEFAKPILRSLRKSIHDVCPDVCETMKWSFPHFEYHGVLCSMAAFQRHCAFVFWKRALLPDPDKILNLSGPSAMGHLGRIEKLSDLPKSATFKKYLRVAMKLNEQGIAVPKTRPGSKKSLSIPADFKKGLAKNPKARKTFAAFSPSNKREYVEWISEAKTSATRQKRLATSIEWLSEGKIRNWKYVRKSS